jgi:uncharacterized protein (UPF0332 family)
MTQFEHNDFDMENRKKSQSYWELSHESLKTAKFTEVDFPKNAIENAYYSAFYAAHSLLALRGVFPKTHEGVSHKLKELFCNSTSLASDEYKILGNLEESRMKATYKLGIKYSAEDAQIRVKKADIFFKAIEKLRKKELIQEIDGQENENSFPDTQILQENVSEPQSIDTVRQAAQKISEIEGISKSADGISVVAGADISETQEKYLRDAVKGKQEIQEAETMNNNRGIENIISVGQRVSLETSNKNRLTGEITKVEGNSITIKAGRSELTLDKKTIKANGWEMNPVSPVPKTKTLEFAKARAKEIMGPSAAVAGAANGRRYSGKIVGMTEAYAIQSLNSNSAILHKLEDLSKAEKDGKGQIKVREGESLSIARDSFGVVSLTPYDSEREKKEKERQKQLQRGSQQVGSRGL